MKSNEGSKLISALESTPAIHPQQRKVGPATAPKPAIDRGRKRLCELLLKELPQLPRRQGLGNPRKDPVVSGTREFGNEVRVETCAEINGVIVFWVL